jgi:hypothetical protein
MFSLYELMGVFTNLAAGGKGNGCRWLMTADKPCSGDTRMHGLGRAAGRGMA